MHKMEFCAFYVEGSLRWGYTNGKIPLYAGRITLNLCHILIGRTFSDEVYREFYQELDRDCGELPILLSHDIMLRRLCTFAGLVWHPILLIFDTPEMPVFLLHGSERTQIEYAEFDQSDDDTMYIMYSEDGFRELTREYTTL